MHHVLIFALFSLLGLAGYLLGSVPFGQLFARHKGLDLRQVGSGNIGATNAARALGRRTGALVLCLDAAKAALPMWLLSRLWPTAPNLPWLQATLGAGAFLGHVYSLFLRFQGGKGVATAFGAFLVLCPPAAALSALCYAGAFAVSRISSVGSLCGVLTFPLWLVLFDAPLAAFALCALTLVIILLRHRDNIRRLLHHEERRM